MPPLPLITGLGINKNDQKPGTANISGSNSSVERSTTCSKSHQLTSAVSMRVSSGLIESHRDS